MDGTMVLKLEGDLRQDIVNGSVHAHAYDMSAQLPRTNESKPAPHSITLVYMICHYISTSYMALMIAHVHL
jgi:hypothetical protein